MFEGLSDILGLNIGILRLGLYCETNLNDLRALIYFAIKWYASDEGDPV